MGLLDALYNSNTYGGTGGGLLDLLRNNAMNQQMGSGLQSDQAQYGQPMNAMAQMQPQIFGANQPSPLDNASWPAGPIGAPQQNAQPSPLDTAQWPHGPVGAPSQANAQMPAQQPMQPPQQPQPPLQPQLANPGGLGAGLNGFLGNLHNGPLGALIGGIGSAAGLQDPTTQIAQKHANVTAQALRAKGIPEEAIAAAVGDGRVPGDKTLLEALVKQAYPQQSVTSIGDGYVADKYGKITRAYKPEEKAPTSVSEYEYYRANPTPGQPVMDYGTWASKKARDAANNIVNNVDMNSGQTYDKQLAEGLGKAHAGLANGVEDAQTRARDIAAMQAAVDAIQKNGGTTGGLGQQQVLDLKKTINAGMASLGVEKPFNEGDLSDKEFLTKFNRSMAGAQAKNAVGSRVTNFEMSNFLKANPGLDMSITGNQRLLGIQAQIEERNIAVGNAIRDATAEAISQGKKINPVTVQKIVKDYDDANHIKDVVTGQDLTQSYSLPEFQKSETNASMAKAHGENLKAIEKTIGNVTYVQRDGQWYPK
jgi:hypothetical protein